MGRMKRAPAKPLLREVTELERHVNAKGEPLRPGHVVRVPAYRSAAMGIEVPQRVGRLVRLYQREGDERVLADLLGLGGLVTAAADQVVWSSARLDGQGEPPQRRRPLVIDDS